MRKSPLAAIVFSALCASVPAWAAEPSDKPSKGQGEATLSEDFVIRGKKAGGPNIWVPQPVVEKAVVTEVIESLDIYKGDHRPAIPKVQVPAEAKRLRRPFPTPPLLSFDPETLSRPFRSWTFEILEAPGEKAVWRAYGSRRVVDPLSWDGRDNEGRMTARVGGRYYFQFTGTQGEEGYTLVSEPVEITSLNFQENLGNIRMEVSNSLIFGEKSSKLRRVAADYLNLIAAALARAHPRGKDNRYDLLLCQDEPGSKLAKARAGTLRSYFSSYLVVKPDKIVVDLQPVGDRGDITACVLPPGKGAAFNTD